MTDLRKQLDGELLAQQMRASFGEVGARVIAAIQERLEAAHARVDAAHDRFEQVDMIASRSIKRIAALEDKAAAPLANEHGTGGIYDRLSKLGNTVTFLSQQLDFEALRGPRTVAARLNALEKAERERPTAPPERHWQGDEPTVQLRRDVDALAKAAYGAWLDMPLGSKRFALIEALRSFAAEYGLVLPAPEEP